MRNRRVEMKRFAFIMVGTVCLSAMLLVLTGLAAAAPSQAGLLSRVERACQQAHQQGRLESMPKVERDNLPQLAQAQCAQVRGSSLYALGELKDQGALEVIVGGLHDQDAHVRRIAARALGKIGDTRALEPLAQSLNDPSERPMVRAAAAQALGMFNDAQAAQVLQQNADAKPEMVRKAVDKALSRIAAAQEMMASN